MSLINSDIFPLFCNRFFLSDSFSFAISTAIIRHGVKSCCSWYLSSYMTSNTTTILFFHLIPWSHRVLSFIVMTPSIKLKMHKLFCRRSIFVEHNNMKNALVCLRVMHKQSFQVHKSDKMWNMWFFIYIHSMCTHKNLKW